MPRNQDKCVLGNSSPFPECLKMLDSRPFIVSFSNYALGFSLTNLVFGQNIFDSSAQVFFSDF